MAETKKDRLEQLFSTDSGRRSSIKEVQRWTGIKSRSYVYDVADSLGYKRIGDEWMSEKNVEARGDIQYQMIAEMHDRIVGRSNIEMLPPIWDETDGYVTINNVTAKPLSASTAKKIADLIPKLGEGQSIDGMQDLASLVVGAILYRINELEN